jgi:hypothetical protein
MRSLAEIYETRPKGVWAIGAAIGKWLRLIAAAVATLLAITFVLAFVIALVTGRNFRDSLGLAIIATEFVAVTPLFLVVKGSLPTIDI